MTDEIPTPHEISAGVRDALPRPNRPMAPFMWYGGKGNLARRLMPLLPAGRVYVEPYAGAASMFWHLRPPREVEVLNDLHEEIVNLFRVLQDAERFAALAHRLTWTPYSLAEFRRALAAGTNGDEVDRAWAFFVRQNQGFSGIAETEGNWSRAFESSRGMAETAAIWRARLGLLDAWHERLTRVQIDCRDALEVIDYWDSADTVFYIDPPYAADSRVKGNRNVYVHEATDGHHEALVARLAGINGQAMLSGYATALYDPLVEAGWERHEFATACHAAGRVRGSKLRGTGAATEHAARTEVVWVTPPRAEGRLF